VSFVLSLILGSCKELEPESTILENVLQEIDSTSSVMEAHTAADSKTLSAADSVVQLNSYKKVSKLNNWYYTMRSDSMEYTCIELTRTDAGLLAFGAFRTLSDANPEHDLTMIVQDSIYMAQSEWFLCENTIFSYKFHFAFDAFEMFSDLSMISIGYPGWIFSGEQKYMIEFNATNFSEIISDLILSDSDTRKVDSNWFISQGVEGMGLEFKKNKPHSK
jgi:hypothetical protein